VVLPVISQARHRIHRGQPDRWWLIATQLLGDRVESFVQGSSALLCERSVQLLALRLQRLVQLLALLSQRRFGVPAGHGLDGGAAAERPACFGSPGFPLARGQLGQAAFHLGVQRGPAGEAVLAGHRQLGGRQRYPFRESTDPGQGSWLTVSGCTKQLARLAAKLVDVGAARELGHDVSSQPRLACGLDKKTILPESITPEQRWTQVLPANPAAPSNADAKSL
jgi:hypothetical protein